MLIAYRNNFAFALHLDTVTSPAMVDETTWDQNSYVMITWYRAVVCMLDFRLSPSCEIFPLLECFVAFVSICGRFAVTYGSHLQGSNSCVTVEDETDSLSRNVADYLPIYAA